MRNFTPYVIFIAMAASSFLLILSGLNQTTVAKMEHPKPDLTKTWATIDLETEIRALCDARAEEIGMTAKRECQMAQRQAAGTLDGMIRVTFDELDQATPERRQRADEIRGRIDTCFAKNRDLHHRLDRVEVIRCIRQQ